MTCLNPQQPRGTKTTTLRAALIGCGKRGRFHAQAMAGAEDFNLGCVCDLDADRATAIAADVGVSHIETDFLKMLETHRPDVVGFCAPPHVRSSVIMPVLESGVKALVIEKPIALDVTEARRIAAAAKQAGVHLIVCHECRYADEMVKLRSLINTGRLGRIDRIQGTCRLNLLDQGTHVLDLLNGLAGDVGPDWVLAQVDGVEAFVQPGPTGHAAPAHTLMQLGYGDLTATLTLGGRGARLPEHADAPYLQFQLMVVGEQGIAKATLGHSCELLNDAGRETFPSRPFEQDAYMTRALYDEVAATIDGVQKRHQCDIAHASRAQETVEAGYASALSRRHIPLPSPGVAGASRRLKSEMVTHQPIAVSTLLYARHPRRNVLRSIAEAGFEHVDLWMYPEIAQHMDPERETIADVRRDLAEFGLTAEIVSFYGGRPYERRFRAAAELGAKLVVRGGINPHTQREKLDDLRAQADLCEKLGIHLVLENHIHQMESIEHMQTLMAELQHPVVRLCLAPSHLALAGERMEDALCALGTQVDLIYLWDMDFSLPRSEQEQFWHNADAQVPGASDVNFHTLLQAAVRHAPQARWSMTWHGSENWPIERVDAALRRAGRHIERCRPAATELFDVDLVPTRRP